MRALAVACGLLVLVTAGCRPDLPPRPGSVTITVTGESSFEEGSLFRVLLGRPGQEPFAEELLPSESWVLEEVPLPPGRYQVDVVEQACGEGGCGTAPAQPRRDWTRVCRNEFSLAEEEELRVHLHIATDLGRSCTLTVDAAE